MALSASGTCVLLFFSAFIFISLDGKNINQAITIRTFVSRNNELWFQAGGGIVAKSNVENELQEVNNKLGALRKAIELAEKL